MYVFLLLRRWGYCAECASSCGVVREFMEVSCRWRLGKEWNPSYILGKIIGFQLNAVWVKFFTFTMGRPWSMCLSVRWIQLRDESQRFLSPLIFVCLLLVSNIKGMETCLSRKK